MNNAWTIEYTRLFLLIVAGVIIGLITQRWGLAILLPSILYIGWTTLQIRAFERWIRHGAKMEDAPNADGIWQLIVQHIYRAQKKNTERKTHLTNLANSFESTIAALPYATVTLNEYMEIMWANDAAKDTLGINKITDIGQRFDNLVRDPALQSLIENNNDNGNGNDKGNDKGTRAKQLTSPVNPAITLMVSSVVFDGNQRLITAKDISQIVSVQKLRKAFIANASHELRTPLTVISGYLEIMASDDSLPSQLNHMINNASEQALRMESILTDLLTLSKLEEKSQVYAKDSGEKIHLASMIGKLASEIKQTNEGYTINVDIPDSLYMQASESEMLSLCQNLLTNAVKYSAEDSTIQIDYQQRNNGSAVIRFKDNGEGIAPEHLSRLTERFFRVNTTRSRNVGGTGLGLSIVKHILENHGGHLDIQSELGKGSAFTAHLPNYRVVNG